MLKVREVSVTRRPSRHKRRRNVKFEQKWT